jgi:hypothetical protein
MKWLKVMAMALASSGGYQKAWRAACRNMKAQ